MNDNLNEKKTETSAEERTEDLKDHIKTITDNIKTKADEAANAFMKSELGIELLGEDGKFDSEDVKRLADKAKESKIGKAVLGEDGRFDKEDIERFAEDAKKTAKEVADKAKELFQK